MLARIRSRVVELVKTVPLGVLLEYGGRLLSTVWWIFLSPKSQIFA
jgi:hypothetical protein